MSAMTLAGEHCSIGESRWIVHTTNVDPRLLLALAPLVIIELALKIYSIVDLYKPERRVRGGNKLIWLLAILLVSTLGWVVYLIVGREEG
jgi:formate hydrogenlyase subunit 4